VKAVAVPRLHPLEAAAEEVPSAAVTAMVVAASVPKAEAARAQRCP
jgi:hypothetical protein